jgi:hypothetical protein
MKKLASFFGSIILFLLGAVICTALSLFVIGAFCVSYPVLRLKPRDAKMKAIMDLLLAIATAVQVLKPQEIEDLVEAVTDEEKVAPTNT